MNDDLISNILLVILGIAAFIELGVVILIFIKFMGLCI